MASRKGWQRCVCRHHPQGCRRPQTLPLNAALPCAWRRSGAAAALRRLRDAGVGLAVVSNFDTRLRPLLRDMDLDRLFDQVVVSAGELCL